MEMEEMCKGTGGFDYELRENGDWFPGWWWKKGQKREQNIMLIFKFYII